MRQIFAAPVALEEHTLVTIERVRDERLAAAPAVEGRLQNMHRELLVASRPALVAPVAVLTPNR